MQDSFVFYRSFHEALTDLTMEQYGKIMFAINEYALNDIEPELSGIEKMVFTLIKPQIDANKKRRACGTKGGRPKKSIPVENKIELQEKQELVEETIPASAPISENKTVTENTEEKPEPAEKPKPKIKKFVRPTLEQIKEYCAEMHYTINAERFFDYYESKGWLVGKSPMKDWKAACRNWNYNDFGNYSGTINRDKDSTQLQEIENFFQGNTDAFNNEF